MKATNTSVARQFIFDFFSDCNGAMMVHSGNSTTVEILVFYNQINLHYQKAFQYHNKTINTKIYRTSNCYALLQPEKNNKKLIRMFSDGTILKDYDHEIETIQSEAQILLERNQTYSIHHKKDFFTDIFLEPSVCA